MVMVSKGYRMVAAIDYDEVHAPVHKHSSHLEPAGCRNYFKLNGDSGNLLHIYSRSEAPSYITNTVNRKIEHIFCRANAYLRTLC
jgi:hypothetical protein